MQRPREGGLRRGKIFWLCFTTTSAQCLRLSERLFHLFCQSYKTAAAAAIDRPDHEIVLCHQDYPWPMLPVAGIMAGIMPCSIIRCVGDRCAPRHALPGHCVSYKSDVWQITILLVILIDLVTFANYRCSLSIATKMLPIYWPHIWGYGLYTGVACSWDFTVFKISKGKSTTSLMNVNFLYLCLVCFSIMFVLIVISMWYFALI